MNDNMAALAAGLDRNLPATMDDILSVQKRLGVTFPQDYVAFMMTSNGAEGWVGENSYLQLSPIEELPTLNAAGATEEFAPNLVVLASDGGGEAFAFDRTTSPASIVQTPFIGMGEDIEPMGTTFEEFLRRLTML